MSLREEIFKVSKDLLIKDGFSKMSMRRIAREANVSATSIYLHFTNKDDLLLALIEESIENLKGALMEVVDGSKSFITQLRDLAEAYVRFALENPQEYEIIYIVRPEEMPEYPKEKFRNIRTTYGLLADMIEEAHKKENVDEDDPLIAAYTFWAQLHGVVSVILNKRIDNRIPQDRFIAQAIDHIVQGFIIQQTPA